MNKRPYLFALCRQSLAAASTNRGQFLFLSVAMGLQNAMFFILWVVFFGAVHDIRGWRLSDMGLFIGTLCMGVGAAFFLCEGSRRLAGLIRDGELDVYLLRPRHPLPQLISLEANPSGLGDFIYGLLMLVFVGKPDSEGFVFALITAACVGIIFVSMVVIFQSLAFFIKGGSRLAEELFIAMICLGSIPQHAQGMVMKFVLFTILPAGFMAILPVDLIRHHNFVLLGVMIGAGAAYAALAVTIFQRGLRRYTSATGGTA